MSVNFYLIAFPTGLEREQVMPATANTARPKGQADFSKRVKIRLIELGLSVTELADQLGLNRNTVSLAINRGLFQPTRERIASHLSIRL